jgi:hypothetical protein
MLIHREIGTSNDKLSTNALLLEPICPDILLKY